jgi:hypothetical protein
MSTEEIRKKAATSYSDPDKTDAMLRQTICDAADDIERLQEQRAALRDALYKLRASIGATPSGEPQYLLRPALERWCRDIDAALGDARPADLARCTHELRKKGVAYPRTCEVCGLGPCSNPNKPA